MNSQESDEIRESEDFALVHLFSKPLPVSREGGKVAIARHQLVTRPALDDAAVMHDPNMVAHAHRAQRVRACTR